MKITEIVKAKSTRYTVFVDNEYWYILDLEIIMQNHLKVGMDVDEAFLDDIKEQAERRKAKERAYYLLGYRDHSKKELYVKLLKSARPEIALEVVLLMEEQGFINDVAYAQKLARYYIEQKKWGAKKASFEMHKKGIDKEMALDAIAECEVNPIEQITQLIDKKYARFLDDFKGKQKVVAVLSRLGYSYDDIKIAMSAYRLMLEDEITLDE